MKIDIQKEAEVQFPLEDPRKEMFHDNHGQRLRRAAFVEGGKFVLSSLTEIVKDAWELGSDYGGIALPEAKEAQEKFIKSLFK